MSILQCIMYKSKICLVMSMGINMYISLNIFLCVQILRIYVRIINIENINIFVISVIIVLIAVALMSVEIENEYSLNSVVVDEVSEQHLNVRIDAEALARTEAGMVVAPSQVDTVPLLQSHASGDQSPGAAGQHAVEHSPPDQKGRQKTHRNLEASTQKLNCRV